MNIPRYAPGCFGSAIAFKESDLICSNCSFAEQCKPVHERNVALLRQKFGIPEPKKQTAPRPEPAPDESRMKLPRKVQDLLDRLDRGDYDVVGSLRAGRNPFGAALPHLAIACHVLLRAAQLGKTVQRDTLTTAMETKLKVKREAASGYARIAICALEHVGAIDNIDGTISIRRSE